MVGWWFWGLLMFFQVSKVWGSGWCSYDDLKIRLLLAGKAKANKETAESFLGIVGRSTQGLQTKIKMGFLIEWFPNPWTKAEFNTLLLFTENDDKQTLQCPEQSIPNIWSWTAIPQADACISADGIQRGVHCNDVQLQWSFFCPDAKWSTGRDSIQYASNTYRHQDTKEIVIMISSRPFIKSSWNTARCLGCFFLLLALWNPTPSFLASILSRLGLLNSRVIPNKHPKTALLAKKLPSKQRGKHR